MSKAELREEITRRKALEESLRILTLQEDELRQIRSELYDVVAETLAGINIRLAVLRSQTSSNAKDFYDKIDVSERLVEQSVKIVHRFASDLRPLVLDDIGLIPALQSNFNSFEERTGTPTSFTALSAIETLDSSARTALFRIAPEALSNIARHAPASYVAITLRPGKFCVRMKIRDDGKGFDVEDKSTGRSGRRLGLLGMRDRAEMVGGSLRIESEVGVGTTVSVEVPQGETVSERRSAPRAKPAKKAR